ncbi:hypothetical protein EYC80_006111 [Monilinia laxa]|uniref:Uncharacterized protein n=1 Tax=Monilinia laxa TaxID=61186 RepID=A0A5N6KG57_MONLA|nr:hypothetical protein EYC80_006111 [Monilinia laxa]
MPGEKKFRLQLQLQSHSHSHSQPTPKPNPHQSVLFNDQSIHSLFYNTPYTPTKTMLIARRDLPLAKSAPYFETFIDRGRNFEKVAGVMNCPSLLTSNSPKVSAFSMNDAVGLLFSNASTIMGLQIPVHRLFFSSKYGLSGGT